MISFIERPCVFIAAVFRAFLKRLGGQPEHLRQANEEVTERLQVGRMETLEAAEKFKTTARANIRHAAAARCAAKQVIRRIEQARSEQHDGP